MSAQPFRGADFAQRPGESLAAWEARNDLQLAANAATRAALAAHAELTPPEPTLTVYTLAVTVKLRGSALHSGAQFITALADLRAVANVVHVQGTSWREVTSG